MTQPWTVRYSGVCTGLLGIPSTLRHTFLDPLSSAGLCGVCQYSTLASVRSWYVLVVLSGIALLVAQYFILPVRTLSGATPISKGPPRVAGMQAKL